MNLLTELELDGENTFWCTTYQFYLQHLLKCTAFWIHVSFCYNQINCLMFISVFQLARYSTEGLLQLGPLGSTTFLPNTKCLIDDGRGRTPSLKKCDSVSRVSQRLWDFTQVKTKHKWIKIK